MPIRIFRLPAGAALPTLLSSLLLATLGLAACTPTLNWRETTLSDSGRLQFPCKPEQVEREVRLADAPSRARMLVCDAGGLNWSATVYDVPDPARLGPSLRDLRTRFLMNLNASEDRTLPARLTGMTPNDEARRIVATGRLADGRTTRAEAVFVARGTQVYQLVVMARGDAPKQWAESADEFLQALRWPL